MALGVRRAGYFEWQKRPKQSDRDADLVSALKEIRKNHPCYGTQSMIDELPENLKISYGKGYRICRDYGILTNKRKPNGITKSDPAAQSSEDLIKRDFYADTPNTKLLTDITEMQCRDGKLYLSPILDCFDGAIVGFSIDNHMKAELCEAAMQSFIKGYKGFSGCIVHSDRGSQYTSRLFRDLLAEKGFKQSMGRTGTCSDNARMESFFATFKKELIYRLPMYKLTRAQVRIYVFEWIAYYNRKRRHTANDGKLPPLVKRQLYFQQMYGNFDALHSRAG